uniref:Uncharacterized protein n=1 Tax=Oryza nivara TaxID=4536 RepID=A0A0E0IXS5_ORYNI
MECQRRGKRRDGLVGDRSRFHNGLLPWRHQSLFLFAIVLVAASQVQLAVNTDPFMSGACKTVAGSNGGVISVTFCMDALGSDSRSLNANHYSDLAIVAIDLLTSNATSVNAKIDSILKDDGGGLKPDDATTVCLQMCQVAYAGVCRTKEAD